MDGSMGVASEAQVMAVRILDMHFARPPRHVGGRLENLGSAVFVLSVERVYVVYEDHHPGSRPALRSGAQKDRNLVPCYAAECRRIAPLPSFGEAQLIDVVIDGPGEIAHVQDRGYTLEVVLPWLRQHLRRPLLRLFEPLQHLL